MGWVVITLFTLHVHRASETKQKKDEAMVKQKKILHF